VADNTRVGGLDFGALHGCPPIFENHAHLFVAMLVGEQQARLVAVHIDAAHGAGYFSAALTAVGAFSSRRNFF